MASLKDSGFIVEDSSSSSDDDIGIIRSTLSGIASGVFKIPEGAFSLGASLLDLGLGTNTAASVEKFFETISQHGSCHGCKNKPRLESQLSG